MGQSGSALANITPELILGDARENIKSMAATNDGVLIIDDTKTVTILDFDGTVINKTLSLQPTCCCATSTGGWILGFKTGQISEFDEKMNLLFSYRLPGTARAHSGQVTHVRENADTESKKCHLISVADDGTCNLWGPNGSHLYCFTSQSGLCAMESSPFFAFLADKSGKMYTVSADSLSSTSFALPSPARCIAPIGDGFGCIAALDNGAIAICSSTNVVDVFTFDQKFVKVVPLHVEEGVGLITYIATDEEGNLYNCALDYIIEQIGEGSPLFAQNSHRLIVILKEKIAVFSLERFRFAALDNLPDIELPRKEIADFLMRTI